VAVRWQAVTIDSYQTKSWPYALICHLKLGHILGVLLFTCNFRTLPCILLINLMWLKMRDQIQLHYENRSIQISYPLCQWLKNWPIVTLDWAILTGTVLCVLHIPADEGADLGGNQETGDENWLSPPSPGIK